MTEAERKKIRTALRYIGSERNYEKGIIILQKLIDGKSSLEEMFKGLKPVSLGEIMERNRKKL